MAKAEVDVFRRTANNNTRTLWQGSVGSVGVKGCGEFYIVILSIPGISCMLSRKGSMRNYKSEIEGISNGIQEVGLIHSSEEASNDCGAKGLA